MKRVMVLILAAALILSGCSNENELVEAEVLVGYMVLADGCS